MPNCAQPLHWLPLRDSPKGWLLLRSLNSGQYDDLDGAAERILIEDENDRA
jgi:hypothetical protein